MSRNNKGWDSPKDEWLKLNFDGAFSIERHTAGMGVILRKAKGKMITTRSGRRPASSPLQAESEATLMGLRAVSALGITHY